MTSLASTSATAPALGGSSAPAAERQLPIVLKTSLSTLQIPVQPYLVPVSWRRTHLSTLVNRLLSDGSAGLASATTIPFDFIVEGQLLRTSLEQWLEANGKTEEETIEIEYVRSTLPPRFTAAYEQDDWISDVDASRAGMFVTSSYDSTLRIFGQEGTSAILTHRLPTAGGLTSARWLSQASDGSSHLIACAMDGQVHLLSLPSTTLDVSSGPDAQLPSPALLGSGTTHASAAVHAPLSALAVKDAQALVASWDGSFALWSAAGLTTRDPEAGLSKKRRKGERGALGAPTATAVLEPQSVFWHAPPAPGMGAVTTAPNARVAGVVWGRNGEAYSAGWNGAVREWDVEAQQAGTSKSSDKVILALDHVAGVAPVLLTGHMDRSLALWDMRSTTSAITLSMPSAHAAPVGVVRAHPTSSYLFASGSHDGTVKLWDSRSPKQALFALTKPASSSAKNSSSTTTAAVEKVLALDWDPTGQVVVAGGEDCKLTIHKGEGMGRDDLPTSLGSATA